jgi:hypothetical protein
MSKAKATALPEIKVLSVKQPHAHNIVGGFKKIEHRTWHVHYRGQIYIQASGKPVKVKFETGETDFLPTGLVIGRVMLVDIVKKGHSDFEWVLEKPEEIKPFKLKGQQSLFIRVVDTSKIEVVDNYFEWVNLAK